MYVVRNDLNTSRTAMGSFFWATRIKTELMFRQHRNTRCSRRWKRNI